MPQLATQLEVREVELRAWLEGAGEPPLAVFLAAVEILLLDADSVGRA